MASNQQDPDSSFLLQAYQRLHEALAQRDDSVLPAEPSFAAAFASLPRPGSFGAEPGSTHTGPAGAPYLAGLGPERTLDHLLGDIVPALNGQALSGRYFGFVTGSVLPIAHAADNIVSALDQNVCVHMPAHSASTAVEDAALQMLIALLDLGAPGDWPGRIFTTGATASNVLGLACGREAVVAARLPEDVRGKGAVGELGLVAACSAAGLTKGVQVLTSMGHSSLYKAASAVGLGRTSVKELPLSEAEPWRLDLDAVERELARSDVASIISISAGEVNTGRFATNALDIPKLRSLADRHKAWIHVDGAFGIFARALPRTEEFVSLHANTAGLELADSITADGHKLLNVPYDNGVFFCRHASVINEVFQNPNAVYLATDQTGIPSPLNIGLENSRRFRALPVYAALVSQGREGMADMFAKIVRFTRDIAAFIRDSDDYDWLPDAEASLESTHIIVMFKAKDEALNESLVTRINETRRMYVSGTKWKGVKAVRLAVSSWRVDLAKDAPIVKEVLASVAKNHS
ncbi:pyridoxal-dependent decarboxylase [Thozetella sp. PMI_491]|nr:pyridoxal-dependent decarboxylase [Thozetella sp. PMI_491]